MYSQTPGLGRTASAIHGGRTIASYKVITKNEVRSHNYKNIYKYKTLYEQINMWNTLMILISYYYL